ncbi:roundabout homolog 3-like isoform X2 [Rhopilema esculentum]|uniref:roundabout homolog 3-like isoform X2 n=1 Tax=Rhopilema esculentum TaxID=499914 RepID=UPI0031E27255
MTSKTTNFLALVATWCLLAQMVNCQGYRPSVKRGPTDSQYRRGTAAKLPCDVIGEPTPAVTWYKDNVPVALVNRVSKQSDNSLLFKRIRKRTDEGFYYCVAKNVYGEDKSVKAHITVMYMSRRFKVTPQSKNVSLLSEISLTCDPPGGSPTPTVSWRKDSTNLQSNSRIRTEDRFGQVYFLRISKALQEDTGNYTCVAKNEAGERVSEPAFLRVLVPPAVRVNQKLVTVNELETAELSCEVSGVPSPAVSWYKGSEGLPFSKRLLFKTPGKIQILSAQKSDAGVYTCRASNTEGFAEENISLRVKMLPKFLTRPGNLKVGVGQNARFDCKVEAEPGFKIIWQKTVGAHSVLLIRDQLPSRRITVGYDDSLSIKNVQKKDEASYVCTVISELKTASATARLTVVDSIRPLPEVSIFPTNQTVLEGRDVNVTCTAKGSPKPTVNWKSASSNARITEDTEGVVLLTNGSKHTLILKGVRASDAGSYRCIATNADRTVSKVAYLNVVPVPRLPEPPDYVDFLNVTSTSLVLRWKASRNPPGAPVTSYVVSIYDMEGHVWKALASKIQQLEYTVKKLQPGTRYEFRITAVNSIGRGKPSKSTGVIQTKLAVMPSLKPAMTITSKPVDKLLDINLYVEVTRGNKAGEFNISWKSVKPPSRVNGYEVHWKKASEDEFNHEVIPDGKSNSYTLKDLDLGTSYQVKIRAFNKRYGSTFSDLKSFPTMIEQKVSIPPPDNVKVKVHGSGKVLVTWQQSSVRKLTGYEIVWIPLDGTSVETKTVPKNTTFYLIRGLDPEKAYYVTLALVVNNQPGLKSQKLQITPKEESKSDTGGEKSKMNGKSGGGLEPAEGGSGSRKANKKTSGIVSVLQEPWFICAAGGFVFLILCVILIVIVCRRKRRKHESPVFLPVETNGLLQSNRTPVNSISRTRASYRDSAFLWGEHEPVHVPGFSVQSNKPGFKSINGTVEVESANKSEFKPLLGGRSIDSGEMKRNAGGIEAQRPLKEANNLRKPGETGSVSSANREIFLNNLKSDKLMERYASSPKTSLKRNIDVSQDKPRLKIQAAFDSPQTFNDMEMDDLSASKKSMLERHAEIVRTSSKKFESDLVNCMENNTQATWKREKMKEAPEVLVSGEDTLKRKAKNSLKPFPKLEVLNWADYPATASKPGSSAGSPPSSPKTSASALSDNNGSRATSRASQGSMTSLNKYPYTGRSGHAPSVSSRRMSQSSSMMSSELYQSEMEPSVYSDAASEKKKPKSKALPPPIDLDGLTSDILLQWAESVTNSSPSSSGSSSPSRMSAVSSDGSFLTDEDFAQAVAAVVECGGFMDFDYSLSNMPGLQAPPSRPTPTDRQHKLKMEKIDAMIASKGKSSRSNAANQRMRQETCSPPSVTPISFSSYLSNNPKRTGASSLSNAPSSSNKHRQRSSNQAAPSDASGLRFGGNEGEVPASFGTPLTMSNLRQHDSSLGREKKLTKPLTISNLKQHDSSLERTKKPTEKEEIDPGDEVFDDSVKTGLSNGNVAQPLSVISALERNESLGSTKDSKSSINSEIEGRGTSERRKEKRYVVNLNDPTSSTGTSTASTVRTSQDQTEC